MYVVDIFTVISIDPCLLNSKIKFIETSFYLLNKAAAPPVETILVEDVLSILNTSVAVMKIDVEYMECKVKI
jgi:hypothetical protein